MFEEIEKYKELLIKSKAQFNKQCLNNVEKDFNYLKDELEDKKRRNTVIPKIDIGDMINNHNDMMETD